MQTRRVAVGAGMAVLFLSVLGGARVPAGAATPTGLLVHGCEIIDNPTPVSPTRCTSVMLAGASLVGQNLAYAVFTDATFTGADLANAVLTGADLGGVNLSGADLRGADLADANLKGADLKGADLTGASITDATLDGAVWKNTVCPDASNSDHDSATCADDSVVLEGEAFSSNPVPQGAPVPPYQLHPSIAGSSSVVVRTSTTSSSTGGSDGAGAMLPFTGVPVGLLLALGAGLFGCGLLLVIIPGSGRRRRKGLRS